MKLKHALALLVVVGLAAGMADAKPGVERAWDGKTLTAHEWGTFTTVQGSDGVSLGGLVHDARDLPGFVYDLRDRANVTGGSTLSKMETPVVYFYAPEARRVTADVRFPKGAITQWYPAASAVNHVPLDKQNRPLEPTGRTIEKLDDGFITWGGRNTLLVMARDAKAELPAVEHDDPWRFCRQVKANDLRVCSQNRAAIKRSKRVVYEYERCLFYRGLGTFDLPFEGRIVEDAISETRYDVQLKMRQTHPTAKKLEHVFVVHVSGDRAGFQHFSSLDRYDGQLSIRLDDKAVVTKRLVRAMADALTKTGLFTDEALAMTRTWQHGWFQDEGTRVLYVLPKDFVEQQLPLKLSSHNHKLRKPDQWKIVRTFVGRTELLSPREEQHIQGTMQDLAFGTPYARADAERTLARWGRFAAPYLRRVLAMTDDAMTRKSVRARLDALAVTR